MYNEFSITMFFDAKNSNIHSLCWFSFDAPLLYILIGIGIFSHLDSNFISDLRCLKKWVNASFDDFREE